MSTMLLLAIVGFLGSMIFALSVGGWRDAFLIAWRETDPVPDDVHTGFVSVIIPARDAAGTLTPLLQDLHVQHWPKELIEVLVVDDGSSDGTASIVQGLMRNWPGLRSVTATGEGKKAAISQGVAEARGEWIVLTDADARCGPRRVERIMRGVKRQNPDMLLLPVETRGHGGWVQTLQEDEQTALLGVAAGTALQGNPVLANGANMAFRKAAFQAVGGYAGDRWASGDDLFLLRRMLKAGRKVSYLLDPEVVVVVQAEERFAGFWKQRLRWAGKMRAVGGWGNLVVLAGLLLPWFLLHVSTSFTVMELMLQRPLAILLLLASAWLLWLIPVLALTLTVRKFLREAGSREHLRRRGATTMLSLLAFSIYAPIIALLSIFIRPMWKGRKT
ncbi:MAG: glycosyltransferase [Flavobacteriales bacterium]|nr:glycosyltransferase [Flavobacteriales bacterium]